MTLVDGLPADSVPVDDRGLLYGDGLFETIRFDGAAASLWPLHMDRLEFGCARMGLVPVARATLARDAETVLKGASGVVRITLTRGSGRRGYAPGSTRGSRRIVAGYPLPAATVGPARLMICQARLAAGSPLAGLKHLGRMEQVLGAREVQVAGFDEGLQIDANDAIVCATSANVLLQRDGKWTTPCVGSAGVKGVFRQWLLERDVMAVEPWALGDLGRIDAALLVNAVRGYRVIGVLADRRLDVDAARRFQHRAGTPWPSAD